MRENETLKPMKCRDTAADVLAKYLTTEFIPKAQRILPGKL
jgi:hypothetical protein